MRYLLSILVCSLRETRLAYQIGPVKTSADSAGQGWHPGAGRSPCDNISLCKEGVVTVRHFPAQLLIVIAAFRGCSVHVTSCERLK